jgi:hypothetical protein
MLKFVHHIQYVVNNRDEFVAYMEKNFGLKLDELEEREAGLKHACLRLARPRSKSQSPLQVPDKPNSWHSMVLASPMSPGQ